MSELGRLLGEARAAQALSLAEVEEATRIRQKYLEALETGDYAALPGGATSRGFLRLYARYLGLDPLEIVAAYTRETGDTGQEFAATNGAEPRPVDYRPIREELSNDQLSGNLWRWAMAMAVVLVLGVGGWGFLGGRLGWKLPEWRALAFFPVVRASETPTTTPTATRWIVYVTPTPPEAPPTVASEPVVSAPTSDLLPFPTPTVEPTITSTPSPTATPEVVTRIFLQAQFTQRSWMLVTVDGTVVEQGLVEAGEERTWEANNSVTLRTGNAGGVSLSLNNQELGILGNVGQVVERTWSVDQGQVIEITPGSGQPVPEAATTPEATSQE